jgi:hypothetical protein
MLKQIIAKLSNIYLLHDSLLNNAENRIPTISEYSTIDRRINRLDIQTDDKLRGNSDLIVAIYFPSINVIDRKKCG